MKGVATPEMILNVGNTGENLISWSSLEQSKFKAPMFTPQPMLPSLPEGRVRGGSLMALLASNAELGSHYGNHTEASTSEQGGTLYCMTHKWV